MKMTNKEAFIQAFEESKSIREKNGKKITKMVIAVQLPTGAVELIINTEQIDEKVVYYGTAYDEQLRLRNNPDVRIVGYMFA
jgi:hypothetical protein